MSEKTRECKRCGAKVAIDASKCPECGKRLFPKFGELTDEQLKRIKRPISIVVWAIVAIIIIFRFIK